MEGPHPAPRSHQPAPGGFGCVVRGHPGLPCSQRGTCGSPRIHADLVAHVIRTAEGCQHLAVVMQCIIPIGRRLGRVCCAGRHTDRERVAHGPAPPATDNGPGTCPSFRPWQHLHRLGLPGTAARGRLHLLCGEAGHPPGQRGRGDLLRNPERRAHPPATPALTGRRGRSHLRLCRNVVQPAPSERKPWLPQPRHLRSVPTVCPVRSQIIDSPINECKSRETTARAVHARKPRRGLQEVGGPCPDPLWAGGTTSRWVTDQIPQTAGDRSRRN